MEGGEGVGPPQPSPTLPPRYSNAKASQTEPLRRFSVDGAGTEESGAGSDEAGAAKPATERRRSNSASYGAVASFQCNLCQISLNSQSQVAQVQRSHFL